MGLLLEEAHIEAPRPFVVKVDQQSEIITIQGIRYTFGIFDQLAFGAKGARFEVGERQDGIVTLYALPREAA